MGKKHKSMTRREFMELTALGAAGAAAYGTGVPSLFAATPKRGGTLTCGMAWLIQTPDPNRYTGTWARQASALTHEGLTTPTSMGERIRITREKGPDAVPDVQPMLADSWEIDKGGTRYVFHLKKGVKFHNGKELDSKDVEWTWQRVMDPRHRASARKQIGAFLKSVETPDKYTIVANMKKPFYAFLVANAWCNTCILPKDSIPMGVIWGSTPTFKPPTTAPPGTGPFKMVKFQQKLGASFERFEDYRVPGLPYLDKVEFKVIMKSVPRTMAMRAHNVDYIYGEDAAWLIKKLEGKEINQLIQLEEEKLNLFPTLSGATITLYLNSHSDKDTPFKDERVRLAFDYSIDKERLAKTLYGELAVPMGQGYHPDISSWGFPDIKHKKRDIEKAKKLLKEAGYPNGVDVELKITPMWGKNDIAGQIIQQMSKAAGFRVKIVSLSGVQYWSATRQYIFNAQIYIISKEDPMHFYYSYLHTDPTKQYKGHAPITGIKDPIMDELLEDMATETDLLKRKAKFKKVVLRCNEKAYLIPYLKGIGSDVWSNRLKNFKPWNHFFPQQAFRETWLEG